LEEFQAGEGKYAEIFNLSTGTSLVFKSLEEFQDGEGKYLGKFLARKQVH
jgi:hypothetical protein